MEETALDGFVRAARIDHVATIAEVSRDTGVAPTSLVLDGVPPIDIAVPLEYTVYPADGTTTATRCRGGPAQKRPKQTLHVQARHTLLPGPAPTSRRCARPPNARVTGTTRSHRSTTSTSCASWSTNEKGPL